MSSWASCTYSVLSPPALAWDEHDTWGEVATRWLFALGCSGAEDPDFHDEGDDDDDDANDADDPSTPASLARALEEIDLVDHIERLGSLGVRGARDLLWLSEEDFGALNLKPIHARKMKWLCDRIRTQLSSGEVDSRGSAVFKAGKAGKKGKGPRQVQLPPCQWEHAEVAERSKTLAERASERARAEHEARADARSEEALHLRRRARTVTPSPPPEGSLSTGGSGGSGGSTRGRSSAGAARGGQSGGRGSAKRGDCCDMLLTVPLAGDSALLPADDKNENEHGIDDDFSYSSTSFHLPPPDKSGVHASSPSSALDSETDAILRAHNEQHSSSRKPTLHSETDAIQRAHNEQHSSSRKPCKPTLCKPPLCTTSPSHTQQQLDKDDKDQWTIPVRFIGGAAMARVVTPPKAKTMSRRTHATDDKENMALPGGLAPVCSPKTYDDIMRSVPPSVPTGKQHGRSFRRRGTRSASSIEPDVNAGDTSIAAAAADERNGLFAEVANREPVV